MQVEPLEILVSRDDDDPKNAIEMFRGKPTIGNLCPSHSVGLLRLCRIITFSLTLFVLFILCFGVQVTLPQQAIYTEHKGRLEPLRFIYQRRNWTSEIKYGIKI